MRSLPEALAWLDRFTNFEAGAGAPGMISAGATEGLSLEPMRALLHLLGDPQDQVESIHITGTNGKGSVATMASRLVAANGLSVGTYSSPHLFTINERIRRNGEMITDAELAELLDGLAAYEPMFDRPPTWFELLTAAAFRFFAEAPVDVAVVEVGLLGRYDATNVITPRVAVCTSIGKDHTDGTPGWEERVASEKAGIVKPASVCVLGEMEDRLAAHFEAEGPERVLRLGRDVHLDEDLLAVGGRLITVSTPLATYEQVHLPVNGEHQSANAAVALAAVEAFFERPLEEDVVAQAFGGLSLPGRFEVVQHEPLVILDGAHNPPAAEALRRTLDEGFAPSGSRYLVLGMLAGRDPREFLEAIEVDRFDLVVCTTPPGERALSAEALALHARRLGVSPRIVPDPVQATEGVLGFAQEEDVVVVTGSFHLMAAARLGVRRAASAPRS